jgi:type III secretory pathway component EscS
MRKLAQIAHEIATDLASLRLPVTAAAAVTTIVGLVQPFGVDLSQQTTRITAALTAVGILAAAISRWTSDEF